MVGRATEVVADVYEVAGLFRRVGDLVAREEGQTQARWQLLSVVSDRALTVAQCGRRLGISRQGVQRVANDLVAEGLADFDKNPDHQRSPLLSPTPEGARTLAAIVDRSQAINDRVFAGVREAELAAVQTTLRTLIGNLQEMADGRPPR